MDRDKVSALLSRCTELRERAEKAEARIKALEREVEELKRDAVPFAAQIAQRKTYSVTEDNESGLAAEKKP
jgi:archaellum component FlaC